MPKPEECTRRYQSLLNQYGLRGRAIQAGKANENGDVEQRHYRFKRALDQALLLRGSRDFADRAEYEAFVRQLLGQLNAGRQQRLAKELAVLRPLPERRLRDAPRRERAETMAKQHKPADPGELLEEMEHAVRNGKELLKDTARDLRTIQACSGQ